MNPLAQSVLLGTSTSSQTRVPLQTARPVLQAHPVLMIGQHVLLAVLATTPILQHPAHVQHPVQGMLLYPTASFGVQPAATLTLHAFHPLHIDSLWDPPTRPFVDRVHTAWARNLLVPIVQLANSLQLLGLLWHPHAKTVQQVPMQQAQGQLHAHLVELVTMEQVPDRLPTPAKLAHRAHTMMIPLQLAARLVVLASLATRQHSRRQANATLAQQAHSPLQASSQQQTSVPSVRLDITLDRQELLTTPLVQHAQQAPIPLCLASPQQTPAPGVILAHTPPRLQQTPSTHVLAVTLEPFRKPLGHTTVPSALHVAMVTGLMSREPQSASSALQDTTPTEQDKPPMAPAIHALLAHGHPQWAPSQLPHALLVAREHIH